MNKIKLALNLNSVEGIKLIPERLAKEAVLVYKKGDLIRRDGFFKKTSVYAERNIWDLGPWEDHEFILEPDSSYIEYDNKLYYKAFIKIFLPGKEHQLIYFNSNKEATECYNRLLRELNLKEIY
jgi:hypothetical protein